MKKLLILFTLFGLLGLEFRTHAYAQGPTGPAGIFDQVYGGVGTSCTRDANADLFTTTVDADSASGQKVLNVTATTDFVAADVVVVNPGGAREEACVIDTVQAAVSITCLSNLAFTHTAAQADVVDLTNRLGPFTAGLRYEFFCHDGAGARVACECMAGTATIDPALSGVNGVPMFITDNIRLMMIRSGKLYFSCIPAADNRVIDVCQRD